MASDDKDDKDVIEVPTTKATSTTNSRPKGALTNAGWNGFFTLWSIAIGFLLTPLLIHYLGTAQYGILLLIWSFTGILSIANFGLGEATLRYVAYHYGDGDLDGVNRVLGATLSFYVVICLIISGVILAATPAIASLLNITAGEQRLVHRLLRLSAVVFSLGIISRAVGSIPMALQRYDISSKINIGQSVVRSVGYVVLVVSKFGILHLVAWDVLTFMGLLCVQGAVARKLAPGIRLVPSFEFRGLREIINYSVFSFLTFIFYTMFRESGKLVLGRYLGPSAVAYLGTPDNISQRVHTVIASSSETLLPRFSANREARTTRSLFVSSTWAALAVSIVFFVPIVVLMHDFLRLWISPEFANESSKVGQLVALSYITQGAFAPAATFFRGTGKPWVVSVVILLAGGVTLLSSVLLIPKYGVVAAGYAYFLGSLAHFLGLLFGWVYLYGAASVPGLMRVVVLPLSVGGLAFILVQAIHVQFVGTTWVWLFALGGSFAGITGLLVFGADWLLGGEAQSKKFIKRVGSSEKIQVLCRFMHVGWTR